MITKIRKLIEKNHLFLVAAHLNPDGDAVSSTLALGNALREMGKDVVVYNGDPVPYSYSFLPGADLLTSDLNLAPEEMFDVGFVLDSGELRRAGEHLRNKCRNLVNIDHHVDSEHFTDFFWVDQHASSTGTLIYRLLRDFPGYQMSTPVATCLYTALISDTGGFRFSNTDQETFQMAADLLNRGVRPAAISSRIFENREEKVLHLLALALATLKVSECGRIASIIVTRQDMEATGTGPEHTDGFINYPRSIRGVEIAFLFREADSGRIKVGFRSNDHIDVALIAQRFGGGGHAKAAGATLKGTLSEVEEMVIGHIKRIIS